MNTMTNSEILNYFQDIATDHVRDSISNSQYFAQNDEEMNAWQTQTDWMGRLTFRTSDVDFDGPKIREMMSETGLKEAQVLVLLEKATAEAFDYEIGMVRLDAEIAANEAEDA